MRSNMKTSAKVRLQPMKDAALTTGDSDEDIRGRKVVDAAGNEVGTIEHLLIDDEQRKVRFLQVESGGFLGFGKTKVLLPVEAIAEIAPDVVHVNQTRDHIAGAPGYDPELVDDDYYSQVYSHYGYGPYWAPGYAYPTYPRHPGATVR